jgi:threonine/homoserine/homoserine lactone efflux protein
MNEFDFFAKGVAIGFVIAAPVGPIGVLCIRRTLAHGRVAGLVSGLGAAAADAFYGGVAAFGLTVISDFLIGQSHWLRVVGGAVLCLLGVRMLLATPAGEAPQVKLNPLFGAFGSTFFLTLTNPMTILAFAAVFAGLGLGGGATGYVAATVLVTGVFLGSAVWWLGLSVGVGLFRNMMQRRALVWTNRISGFIILAFGATVLIAGLT